MSWNGYNSLQSPKYGILAVNPPVKFSLSLHGQNNLNTHIFPLMHKLAIDKDLMDTDPVVDRIGGIRARRNLDLAPLPIGWHETAFLCPPLELAVYTLILDATLSLDKR
jgi:hypothetical protein